MYLPRYIPCDDCNRANPDAYSSRLESPFSRSLESGGSARVGPSDRPELIDRRVLLSHTPKMRTTKTVAISLDPAIAEALERRSKQEHRSRSELLRTAFRQYEQRLDAWERLGSLGRQVAQRQGLDTEEKVAAYAVEAVRHVRLQKP